jgi:hypothetical protein
MSSFTEKVWLCVLSQSDNCHFGFLGKSGMSISESDLNQLTKKYLTVASRGGSEPALRLMSSLDKRILCIRSLCFHTSQHQKIDFGYSTELGLSVSTPFSNTSYASHPADHKHFFILTPLSNTSHLLATANQNQKKQRLSNNKRSHTLKSLP